jgi:hypothetical protein
MTSVSDASSDGVPPPPSVAPPLQAVIISAATAMTAVAVQRNGACAKVRFIS